LERSVREQPAFLDEACAGDEALRREVESLLAHQSQGEHFLEAPALDVAAEALARDESYRSAQAARLIGRVLSDYRVVEKLGSGGMGEVYRAVRVDGTYEKQVAIKIVQSGLSTDYFLARFKNERRILASLDHPNIARLIAMAAQRKKAFLTSSWNASKAGQSTNIVTTTGWLSRDAWSSFASYAPQCSTLIRTW
jgi:serine/threonine-protein kinase